MIREIVITKDRAGLSTKINLKKETLIYGKNIKGPRSEDIWDLKEKAINEPKRLNQESKTLIKETAYALELSKKKVNCLTKNIECERYAGKNVI